MQIPNALATPITPVANSAEWLIAQVIGGAREVNRIPLQYFPAPAVELHFLNRHALVLMSPFPRVGEQFLESTGRNGCVRIREFRHAEYEAAVGSRRSPC